MIRLAEEKASSFGHYHHAQYDVACVYARLGEKEEALAWAGRAAQRVSFIYRLRARSVPEPIRDEIGFRGLVEELRDE